MDDNSNKPRYNNRNRRRHGPRPNAADAYTPPYDAEILAKPIDQIGLSDQTLAVLTAGKIATVGDVVRRRRGDMFRVQSFGKRQLADLSRCLSALGVDFRPDDKPAQSDESSAKPQPNDGRRQDAERKSSRQGERSQGRDERRDERSDRKGNDRTGDRNRPQGQNAEGDRNRSQNQNAEGNRNRPQNQNAEGDRNGRKDKNKNKRPDQRRDYDDNLTLDKVFPKPKKVRLPRIEQETDVYVKFQRGGKWGFKTKDGIEVIPPIYDEVFNFKEDFACVERKQLFGYINRQNELVIPYRYVCASSFSEGYACVSDEEKCGYINKAGEVVIPFRYEAGTAVTNGLAHVKLDGKWGTLNVATDTISWA